MSDVEIDDVAPIKLYQQTIERVKKNRERVLSGKLNCIPFPFERFRRRFPGIEQGRNFIISANQKVGKSQITDFLFVLWPIVYAYTNRDKLKLKILYFSLELSVQEKLNQFTCFWLYYFHGIRIDSKILRSVNEKKPVPDDVLELLESEEYADFMEFLESVIIFNDTDRNPYGCYKTCVDFALKNGKCTHKMKKFYNAKTETEYEKQVLDTFEWNDPDMYVMKVVDTTNLYSTESGKDLRDTMNKASSQDNVILRNKFKFICVDVQQQAAAKEGDEAFKLDRLAPSADGLADSKVTARDCNIMLGLFSPARFKRKTYEGYDIETFKDNIRFLEICIDRDGSSIGAICPLYFDGACSYFEELPRAKIKAQGSEEWVINPELEKYKKMALEAQKL